MAYTPTTWVNDSLPAIDAIALNRMEVGIQEAHALAASGPGGVQYELPLSSFSGADDDARLSAFMSYAAQQDYKGLTVILDEARQYDFAQKHGLYSGFSIRGAVRPTDQLRSAASTSNKIRIRSSGGLFYLNQSQTFSCAFQGLSIDGTSSTRLIDGHAANVLWTSTFRDITSVNAANVLGSASQKLLLTACVIDGFWNVNNVRERAMVIGGSDIYFSPSKFLLDAEPSHMPDSGYLLGFDFTEKFTMRNFYITSESHSAISWDGSSSAEAAWIENCIIEGRNAGQPALGCLIRVDGGMLDIHRSWLSYAMSNPSGTGRSDGGVVHVADGDVFVDGCVYKRATGVAETVPFIYASGGKVRVRNIRASGSWTGKPRVYETTPGLIDADDSVTVVTA